jgi:hypothetical protein
MDTLGRGIELIIELVYFMDSRCILVRQTLLQEPLRHLRTPNSQRLVSSRTPSHRRIFVHQIAISIVLDHVAGRVPPYESINQSAQLTRENANIDATNLQ